MSKKILVEKMDGFGGLSKMTLEIYDEKEELGRWNSNGEGLGRSMYLVLEMEERRVLGK